MRPVRDSLLLLSRSHAAKRALTTLPLTAALVRTYVPGPSVADAVDAVAALAAEGIGATVDHLGEETTEVSQADATVAAYRLLLDRLAARGLTLGTGSGMTVELSVKLTAIGLRLADGHRIALENARAICRAAEAVGAAVTIDMEDHTTTEATVEIVRELRRDHPGTGIVLQAYLRRTEDDCRALAHAGSRIRLCKGAYDEPGEVAFTDPGEVDRAYVRCLRLLLDSEAYPMIATHDPRLIEIAGALAGRHGRAVGSYEFQMLYGIRPREQRRLAAAGERVRVYLPYGEEWYGYLVRRLAERPANLTLFLTSLISRK